MSEVVFCTHIFFEKSGAFEQSSFGSSFSNVPEIIADWIALEINLVRSSGDEILGEGEVVTILGLLPAIGAFERASVLGIGLGFGSGAGVGLGSDLGAVLGVGVGLGSGTGFEELIIWVSVWFNWTLFSVVFVVLLSPQAIIGKINKMKRSYNEIHGIELG